MTEAASIWKSKLSRLQDPNLEKMKPLVELMGCAPTLRSGAAHYSGVGARARSLSAVEP